MPKAAAVAEERRIDTAPDLGNSVHLVTQKKGGIGKSTVARILAEYLLDKHGRVKCFDTDPSQPTFGRIKGLNVEHINILNGDDVDPMLINPTLNEIIESDGPFVIDTGSSSYHALWSYIRGAGLFDVLAENGRPIVVHVPLAAAPDFEDTLQGFDEIAQNVPDKSIVVWLNERENAIERLGVRFLDLEEVERNSHKLLAVVVAKSQRYRWNRQYVAQMLKDGQTFREALEGRDTITRNYLLRVRKELFDELGGAGL